jgi:hypothetical protein
VKNVKIIDAHGLKIQGRGRLGVLEVFAKIPRGVKSFRKNCQGGSTYFGFYCLFITKFLENLPGGGGCFIPPSPPCVHLWLRLYQNIRFRIQRESEARIRCLLRHRPCPDVHRPHAQRTQSGIGRSFETCSFENL